VDHGMPATDHIEGPPKRACPILLRQTSFKALEEEVHFPDAHGSFVKACHTARFGEVEQRGYALTRKGRHLYDRIIHRVDAEAARASQDGMSYEELLQSYFLEFPDSLAELRNQSLAHFSYHVTPKTDRLASDGALKRLGDCPASVQSLVDMGILSYEPITYEDFLPLSAGGIFSSNLPDMTESKKINDCAPDLDGFKEALGATPLDEFKLYEAMEQESLERCCQQLKLKRIILAC
jgi:uncharacterized glyoxalase superfamily metalloenzyme YdcJ